MIRRRLLTGVCSNLAAKATAVGTWFVLTPFLLAHLGTDGYALWVLLTSIAWYGFLLDVGIGGAVIKYVAEHIARDERQAARELVASAVWLFTGLAGAALILGLFAAPILPAVLGVPETLRSETEWLIVMTGVNVAITIAMTPSFAVLHGLQRYDLHNGAHVAATLIEAVAVVGALLAGGGLTGMVAAFIPANILTCYLAASLVRRAAPDLRVRWRGASRDAFRRIAHFSGPLFAIEFSGRLQTKTDEFVIAMFRPLAAVAPYALARKLAELIEAIVTQCVKVVMPLASQLQAGADGTGLQHLYLTASRVALGVCTPLCIVLMFLGGEILSLWVGPSYAQYAPLVGVLAVSYLFRSSQRPAIEILLGIARHRIIAATALATGAANVALSVTLLPRLGLMGAAIGTLVPSAAAAILVVAPFARRALGVTWRQLIAGVWCAALLPGVAAAVALWALRRQVELTSFVAVASASALVALVYAIGYLAMPAAEVERRMGASLVTAALRAWRQRADHSRHAPSSLTSEPVKEAL
jgi:O-antigen/teichoic acid export membrane protein